MALPDYNEETILIAAAKLPPAEAIAFFRAKGFKITWDWRETLADANNATFQVAKSMNMGVLQDVRKMVDKAIADGLTFKQFAAELEPNLVKRGWWGSQIVDGKRVQLGSLHRLNTIYQTNTQSAYNAGRWETQIRDKKRRPFLRLNEILDASSRKSHAEMNGAIQRITSRFWQIQYPPRGFNCRARAQALTEKQARALGITKKANHRPDKGFSNNPGIKVFQAKKSDFDDDLFAEGKKMDPLF